MWLLFGNAVLSIPYNIKASSKISTIKEIMANEYGKEMTSDLELRASMPIELSHPPIEMMYYGFLFSGNLGNAFLSQFSGFFYLNSDYYDYYIRSPHVASGRGSMVTVYKNFELSPSRGLGIHKDNKHIYTDFAAEVLINYGLVIYDEYDEYFKDKYKFNIPENMKVDFNYDMPDVELKHIDFKNTPHTKYYFDKIKSIKLNDIDVFHGEEISKVEASKLVKDVFDNEYKKIKIILKDENVDTSKFSINIWTKYKNKKEYDDAWPSKGYPVYVANIENENIEMKYRPDEDSYKTYDVEYSFDEKVDVYGETSIDNEIAYNLTNDVRNAKLVKDYPNDVNIKDVDTIKFSKFDFVVLDKKEKSALLFTKYIVFMRGMDAAYDYLNNHVYVDDFSEEEKLLVLDTNVLVQGEKYDLKLFPLSIEECHKYFNVEEDGVSYKKLASFTTNEKVSDENGNRIYSLSSDEYWLRDTVGDGNSYDGPDVCYVDNRGAIKTEGMSERRIGPGIRFAMWVRILDDEEMKNAEQIISTKKESENENVTNEMTLQTATIENNNIRPEGTVVEYEEIKFDDKIYYEDSLPFGYRPDYEWQKPSKDIGDEFKINDYSKRYEKYLTYNDNIKVGSVITFGKSRKEKLKEKEPIEWIVLDMDGTRLLLLSKYAINATVFNSDIGKATYGDSYIRKRLSKLFIEYFEIEERKRILTTKVNTFDEFGKEHILNDKLFILSEDEIRKYFNSAISSGDGKSLATATTRSVKAECQTKYLEDIPYDDSDTWHKGNTQYFTRTKIRLSILILMAP